MSNDIGVGKHSKDNKAIEEGPNESTPLIIHSDEIYDLSANYKIIDFLNEFLYLTSATIPIFLSTLAQFATSTINIFSVGQYGALEISAVALSNVFSNSTGFSILMGMATALDTLCSQAFTGANDKAKVGLYLQRGLLVQCILMLPMAFIWWNSESILIKLGQDVEIARLCGKYLRVLILDLPARATFECLKKFMQAQKIMKAQTYVLVLTLPLTALSNYFLMWHPSTSVGFIGASFTLVITDWLLLVFMLLYISFIEGYECWGGWSNECMLNLKEYTKLGFSGMLMVCSEWWAINIISLTVSYLGTQALAAHYITLNIDILLYSIPLSIGIVASNRIGNLLGAQQKYRARLASGVALSMALIVSSINSTFLTIFKDKIPALYTNDQSLIDIVVILIPFTCVYHVFDSLACCSSGILRGQGRQKIGAMVNLISWYFVAIPLSIFIAFYFGYGIQGMWLGICLGLCFTGTILCYYVFKSDWDALILESKKRLESS